MKRRSLTWQLALGLSLMTGLLWLGAAAISAAVMSHAINQAYDYALAQAANRILPLAIHDIREPDERGRVDAIEEDEGTFSYVIRNRAGGIILNDGALPEAILADVGAQGYADTAAGRAFAITDRRSGLGIVVLEGESERRDALGDGLLGLLGPLAALLPLVALGVWVALRLALAPLERLRSDLAERGRHNLAPLDPASYPPELSPIVGELAGLLERLQKALDAERAFAASSAHELRTPIAGALAQTQVLAAELRDHPAAQRTGEIERALRRLSVLAERLLQLARLEAGFARSETDVPLRPIIDLVVRDFVKSGVPVVVEAHPDAAPHGRVNPDAYALVMRNLIDNAVLHGADGEPVAIHVAEDGTVRVINSGPVVPPDILAGLAHPFVRGVTKASGAGIGLSIVRSVVEQAGGTLRLASPAAGRADGFEAVVSLG
ncbi:two-component sensor histidine kinase [Devosia sp. PTR5]|uniref:histidine kinase n=1 Tax=Devosia oryzisoli TaxID=2774138 RepID=A0A927FX87_9HYPH|nr:ATP-binding protein [Devosia oryzisoli]MBD8066578.1 two-component sensor histidine kinase [Devosia oryzisoli]